MCLFIHAIVPRHVETVVKLSQKHIDHSIRVELDLDEFDEMLSETLFYHGSVFAGLDVILANAKSHVDDNKVAYFTTDRVYALVCCRTQEENFVTMGPKDGVQHYFERFPD